MKLNMKRNTLLLLVLPSLLATAGQAQKTLTLQQCREMALQHNKDIAAAERQRQRAAYTVKSTRGNFFPDLSLNGTGAYSTGKTSMGIPGGYLPTGNLDATGQLTPDGRVAYLPNIDLHARLGWLYMGGITLEQPIFMGGKIVTAYRMAQLGESIARQNERLTATDILVKTDEAYAQAVKAKEMKTVADSYHTLLKELLKNVESGRRHGMTSRNDVLKVQVKLNESELNVRRAENAIRLSAMNLCHYIGRPLTADIQVSDALPETTAVPDDADISHRPEYALLEQQVALAGQQVKLQRSELLPQIGLRASYDYMHGMKVNQDYLLNRGSATVLLNVSIPIFHFGERHNKVKAAKMQLEQTRLEQESKNELMRLELTQALNNLDEARLEKALAETSLEQAEENRRVSLKQYEAGLETLSDHLEAQAIWQKAYETKVDAAYRLYLSHLHYLKAAGKLTVSGQF